MRTDYKPLVRRLSDDALHKLITDLVDKHDAHRQRRLRGGTVPTHIHALLAEANHEQERRAARHPLGYDRINLPWLRQREAAVRFHKDRMDNRPRRHSNAPSRTAYVAAYEPPPATEAMRHAQYMGELIDTALRQHVPLTLIKWHKNGYTSRTM